MINDKTKDLVSNTTFTTDLNGIRGSVTTLTNEVNNQTTRITDVDGRVTELNNKHEALSKDVATLDLNPETGLTAQISNLRDEYETLTNGFDGTLSEMQSTHNNIAELVLDPDNGFQVQIDKLEGVSGDVSGMKTTHERMAELVLDPDTGFSMQISRIDAVDKQVSDVNTSLTANIKGITSKVQSNYEDLSGRLDGVSTTVGTLLEQTEDAITVAVTNAKDEIRGEGASKVVTATGFTFDETGLTVTRSDSLLSTQIDDDGMEVKYNDKAILVADSQGVSAQDLHARTYLIIGDQSRFETYTKNNSERTGCFWIGG